MEKSKIETYLGFCIRARKIIFGAEEIEGQRRGIHLLLMDESAGKSSQKSMIKAQENLHCPMLLVEKDELANMLHRPAVKAVAIKDEHLASAILTAAKGESLYKLYSGGNN